MEGPAAVVLVADVFLLSSADGKYLKTKSVTNTLLSVLKLSLRQNSTKCSWATAVSIREDSPTFLELTPSPSSKFC